MWGGKGQEEELAGLWSGAVGALLISRAASAD